MKYRLDLGMWNQVFAVPCALADRHLKLAGKEQLQVILWVLRNSGESFSPGEMAEALGISKEAALESLEYWSDRGLLSSAGGDLRPVPQEEAAPIRPKPIEKAKEEKISEKTALPPRKRMVRADSLHLAQRMDESDSVKFLMQEAEATLGKTLSPAMSSLLLTITDDYGLPTEVTLMLLHYIKESGKAGTAYLDTVARDWAESGIFTLEAAEQKLQDLDRRKLAWGKVQAAAGLLKRSPSKKEEEASYRWVEEWGFTQEMLSAAYELCVDNTGKFSAAYMNKILERWHKTGVKNLSELAAEQQHKQEKTEKSNKSYDIDELERLSFFDLPDNL